MFLHRKPRILFALLTVFLIWVHHHRSSSIVTQRYLLESTTSLVWPYSLYWVGSTFFFFLQILNTTHLMGLKLICQVFSQCYSVERSFWRRALSLSCLMTLNRRLPSAKILDWEDFIDSDRSWMKHWTNRGPRTVPWGTHERLLQILTPSRITPCSLWLRKDSLQRLTFPLRSGPACEVVLCLGLFQNIWKVKQDNVHLMSLGCWRGNILYCWQQ